MILLAASFGCGITAAPEQVSATTPATTAEVEPTATADATDASVPTIEPTATPDTREESGDSRMTITDCSIDTSSSYVKVTLSYETAGDIEESNLFVIAEVLSDKNDPILTLNVDSETRLILVNASGQVLLSTQPYEIDTRGNKGTISFDFPKKEHGYDIGGLEGGMFVAIAETAEPKNIILAEITRDGISY
jgi:hypothetical protein